MKALACRAGRVDFWKKIGKLAVGGDGGNVSTVSTQTCRRSRHICGMIDWGSVNGVLTLAPEAVIVQIGYGIVNSDDLLGKFPCKSRHIQFG